MGATITPIANAAIAVPRRAGGKLSISTAWAIGWSAPPPAPWRIRATTSIPRLVAAPHSADARVNTTMHVTRNRLRPNRLPSHAVIGKTIALDTR